MCVGRFKEELIASYLHMVAANVDLRSVLLVSPPLLCQSVSTFCLYRLFGYNALFEAMLINNSAKFRVCCAPFNF